MNRSYLRIIPLLLLCSLVLCACSAKPPETVQVPTPTPTQDIYASTPTPVPTPAPTPVPTPTPMPEAEQRALIERSRSTWEPNLDYETWFSAVTDLDHNGRLEILTASLQGSGLFTWVNVWEVNQDYTGLAHCPDNTGEGDAWPDIIKDTMTFYRDGASGRYTYVCEDFMRDGAAHYYTGLDSFSLENGQIDVKVLASKDELYSEDGSSTVRFADTNGAEITEEAFNSVEGTAFAGQEKGTLTLTWTQLEKQAQTTPQPQITAQPQVSGPVTITKNPTGESIAVGGRTWFIAHADNATSLTWLLTSPDGRSYTVEEAMTANPGLQLLELPDDTLGISNAPVSLDGWSVQARFDGPGGSAVTSPALIRVDEFVSAYGTVISSYYRAYSSGNTAADYAWSNNISEMIAYSQNAGYALLDLNGDGTAELVIAGIGTDGFANGMIYDLYTLVNGQPVQLACSQARSRYYLRADGSVLNEGSNGAGNTIYVVNRVYGSSLVPVESVMTWFMGEENDGYYHQTDGYNYEPRDYDEYLNEAQFNYFVGSWRDSVYVPQLTLIG